MSNQETPATSPELLQLKRLKWKKSELRYLRDRYAKTPIAVIAASLNKSYSEVSKVMKLLNLKKCAKWSQQEEDYLKDHFDTMELVDIANQLGRSPGAVKFKMHTMGLRVTQSFMHILTVEIAARKLGCAKDILYQGIKNGRLKTGGRKKGKTGGYVLYEEELREYIVYNFPNQRFNCLISGKRVVGDIYHPDHVPYDSKVIKPARPTRFDLLYQAKNPEMPFEMVGIMEEIRAIENFTQAALTEKLGYHKQWYRWLIHNMSANRKHLSLDVLAAVMDALGWTVKVTIERKSGYRDAHTGD